MTTQEMVAMLEKECKGRYMFNHYKDELYVGKQVLDSSDTLIFVQQVGDKFFAFDPMKTFDGASIDERYYLLENAVMRYGKIGIFNGMLSVVCPKGESLSDACDELVEAIKYCIASKICYQGANEKEQRMAFIRAVTKDFFTVSDFSESLIQLKTEDSEELGFNILLNRVDREDFHGYCMIAQGEFKEIIEGMEDSARAAKLDDIWKNYEAKYDNGLIFIYCKTSELTSGYMRLKTAVRLVLLEK